MDLLDLAKEYFKPGSSAIWTDPTHSYGPAQARLTRVPINFNDSIGDNSSGEYSSGAGSTGSSMVDTLTSPFVPKAGITINPTSWDMKVNNKGNVPAIIKHEIAHSILEPGIGTNKLEDLAKQNTFYGSMRNIIENDNHRAGLMPNEVPAYAAQPNPKIYGIPQGLRDLYLNTFNKQLQDTNPDVATQYRRLVGAQ